MNKCWRVCLLVLAVVAGVGQAGAQENPDRIAAIMRDMDRRSAGNSLEPSAPIVPVIQVSATQPAWQPTPQSVIEDQPSGIPEYLLPQVYSSDSLGMNQPVSSVQEIQQQPLGDRFMFSSAFQRRINPPKGNFGNVADDCGCCDEWQTFMPCESCCRDLGLNPWVFQRARPNCPPHWWLHPNRSAECEGCNSGSCGGACGETKSHGWFKHSSW
jgi:hypothetical protein